MTEPTQQISVPVEAAFGPRGAIAQRLGQSFEFRPQQQSMAHAVSEAMASSGQLLVEAGTGVGKSFAYLLPAIERIVEHGERVVVATNTIALQEQLFSKDIPLFQQIFADDDGQPRFNVELVKGRNNYVSIRRLEMASSRQAQLFPDAAARRSLHLIEDWAYETPDGTLSTLPVLDRMDVWDRVQSDSGNCMGRRCPRYEQCFYQRARRRMERAELLICNHALFFSDLALRSQGVGFLPEYQHVILDEAHHVEDVASEHFGVSLSEARVRHLLNVLYHGGRRRGFLATLQIKDATDDLVRRAVERTLDADAAASRFFDQLAALVPGRIGTRAVDAEMDIEDLLAEPIRQLGLALKRLKEHVSRDEDRYEINGYVERAEGIALACQVLTGRTLPGCVYWIETGRTSRGSLRIALSAAPVEVAPILRERLFSQPCSVVLTSATLTTGRSSFEHVKRRLGCDDAQTLALGSPFNHSSQVELFVDQTMPDPRHEDYVAAMASRVIEHISATDGGAFVLFTSFGMMYAVADQVANQFGADGRGFWVQGRDGSRSQILESFRESSRGVLFGTSSFWQGVDVRGEALRNVIIARLPFDPPDRPLTQARLDLIESRGGNGFMDDSLPRAVIRFKQGFGRLIRSATDTGRVVVLDPRIVKARYGRFFLESLPEGIQIRHVDADP